MTKETENKTREKQPKQPKSATGGGLCNPACCLGKAAVIMKVSEYLSKIRVRFKSCPTVLLLVLALSAVLPPSVGQDCDRTFVSAGEGSRNGTFSSPTFENRMGHVRQCLYTFVAAPGERVHLTFHVLALRGMPPECSHEYIDVYAEVADSEPIDLLTSPFGGRYCGQIPPRRRISLYRRLILGFFTDKNSTEGVLFHGTYVFLKEDRYVVGTPIPRTTCSYTIDGLLKRQGEILTPTYPGVYPKNLHCTYKFVGKKGQRIRLEFRDFDIFYGGPHCPFDAVSVFDGTDNKSPLIGTYCGQQRNLVLYSTEQFLTVTFTTLERTADSQNRGFIGMFQFSESFVKLDFISRDDGEHVRGTECDQKIESRKGSSGVVYSPNYPFPYIPGIQCRYFLLGLKDDQHLERVRVDFEKFDIPTTDLTCSDGYLKLYLRDQELNMWDARHDADLCSNNDTSVYWSEGPRLSMIFSSGQTQGSGFKARFLFVTEYRIPGTESPTAGLCNFTYLSTSKKKGDFNSPRFPSRYPSNMTCTYNFVAAANENTKIYFDQFKVKAANNSLITYGVHCQEDWVEIYNVFPRGREVLLGRYCGDSVPGPVESSPGTIGLKVILRTDEEGVYNGFKARYIFSKKGSVYGDCGANLTAPGTSSGVFTSPRWPDKYDRSSGPYNCHWEIQSRPDHKILLHLQSFSIEGELESRGCGLATLRIWKKPEEPPLEICGENLKEEHEQHLSDGNKMMITFITADKVSGGQGFRAVWTEVKTGPGCDQFVCKNNSFCIAKHLECDGTVNCGFNDDSDEAHCGAVRFHSSVFALVLPLVTLLLFHR